MYHLTHGRRSGPCLLVSSAARARPTRSRSTRATFYRLAADRVTIRHISGHLWLVGAHPWHQTVATSLQTVSRRDIQVLLLGQLAMPELQSATWPSRGGRRREAHAAACLLRILWRVASLWAPSEACQATRRCAPRGGPVLPIDRGHWCQWGVTTPSSMPACPSSSFWVVPRPRGYPGLGSRSASARGLSCAPCNVRRPRPARPGRRPDGRRSSAVGLRHCH